MTHGYASDVDGDETVMDSPTVTISIDLTQLPPEQALAIVQQSGSSDLNGEQKGTLLDGKQLESEYAQHARFHIPLGPGLTALSAINAIDIPNDPDEMEDNA